MKSAILLAGLNARGHTVVEEAAATRDHSENMLRHFGAAVDVQVQGAGRVITLAGQPELRARDVAVPGDPSSAAFPLVAGLLVPGSAVTVLGVGLNPLRTGAAGNSARDGRGVAGQRRAGRGRRTGRRPDRDPWHAAGGGRAAGARALDDRRIPSAGRRSRV